MPCYDDRNSCNGDEIIRLQDTIDKRNAMLCAIMHVVEDGGLAHVVLDSVDWKEAGITRSEFNKWWTAHKAEDEKRQEQERKRQEALQEKERQKQKRAELIASMTQEQLDLLGIKK